MDPFAALVGPPYALRNMEGRGQKEGKDVAEREESWAGLLLGTPRTSLSKNSTPSE